MRDFLQPGENRATATSGTERQVEECHATNNRSSGQRQRLGRVSASVHGVYLPTPSTRKFHHSLYIHTRQIGYTAGAQSSKVQKTLWNANVEIYGDGREVARIPQSLDEGNPSFSTKTTGIGRRMDPPRSPSHLPSIPNLPYRV